MVGPEPRARWWDIRPAQNLKPSTYTCPLCGGRLPALSVHMLIVPEGDPARRRHAHSACVVRARAAGGLPTRAELRRAERDRDRAERHRRAPAVTGRVAGWWRRLR